MERSPRRRQYCRHIGVGGIADAAWGAVRTQVGAGENDGVVQARGGQVADLACFDQAMLPPLPTFATASRPAHETVPVMFRVFRFAMPLALTTPVIPAT